MNSHLTDSPTLSILRARVATAAAAAAAAAARSGTVFTDEVDKTSRMIAASNNSTVNSLLVDSRSATDGNAATTYRDFSHVRPDTPDRQIATRPSPSSSSSSLSGSAEKPVSTKEPTFPVKLHMILSNPEFQEIITWLPHGRSWRILQQKAFEERIVPLYFRHGRYSSFARQVNGWGYRRITHGSDYNSYYHELFLRGMPHLCNRMRRLTTKDMSLRKKLDEGPIPDFYAMSRNNPLPDGKESSKSAAEIASDVPVPVPAVQIQKNQVEDPAIRSGSLPGSINGYNIGPNNNGPINAGASQPTAAVGLTSLSGRSAGSDNGRAGSPRALAEIELALLERRRVEILNNLGAMQNMPSGGFLPFALQTANNQHTNQLQLQTLLAARSNFGPSLAAQLQNQLGQLPQGGYALLLAQQQQQQLQRTSLLQQQLLGAQLANGNNSNNIANLLALRNNSIGFNNIESSPSLTLPSSAPSACLPNSRFLGGVPFGM